MEETAIPGLIEEISKKRMRSPSYPAIDLKQAIMLAKTIWDNDRHHPTSIKAVASHWGYNDKSSSALSRIAALKQFGLLQECEAPAMVQLTDLARRILANEDESSPDRIALIKSAALKPRIYQELWTKYGGQLPSDVTLKSYLVGERLFNPDAVETLIKVLRCTIEFSGITDEDRVPEPPKTDDQVQEAVVVRKESTASSGYVSPPGLVAVAKAIASRMIPVNEPSAVPKVPEKKVLARYAIPLGINEAELIFKGEDLQIADFDALIDYVTLFKQQFQRRLDLAQVSRFDVGVDLTQSDWIAKVKEHTSKNRVIYLAGYDTIEHYPAIQEIMDEYNYGPPVDAGLRGIILFRPMRQPQTFRMTMNHPMMMVPGMTDEQRRYREVCAWLEKIAPHIGSQARDITHLNASELSKMLETDIINLRNPELLAEYRQRLSVGTVSFQSRCKIIEELLAGVAPYPETA